MVSFLTRILGNAVALWAAVYFVPGVTVNGGVREYVILGIVLGLLNMIVRPILKLIAFPLVVLSLGLFTLVINAIILWLVDYYFTAITISDFTALAWATIVITVVNLIVSGVTKIL